MAAGKKPGTNRFSPIIQAIGEAESKTTAEIRVHLSRKWVEKNAYRRAVKLFHQFGMTQTTERNGVLLYINLRRRRFAVVGDQGIHQRVEPEYWQTIAHELSEDLRSTHSENAIANAVRRMGETLARHFPLKAGEKNPNQLPDEVSEDRF